MPRRSIPQSSSIKDRGKAERLGHGLKIRTLKKGAGEKEEVQEMEVGVIENSNNN